MLRGDKLTKEKYNYQHVSWKAKKINNIRKIIVAKTYLPFHFGLGTWIWHRTSWTWSSFPCSFSLSQCAAVETSQFSLKTGSKYAALCHWEALATLSYQALSVCSVSLCLRLQANEAVTASYVASSSWCGLDVCVWQSACLYVFV